MHRQPFRSLALAVIVVALSGCGTDTGTSSTTTMQQRQDAALRDPFSYGPSAPANKTPEPAIKPRDNTLKGEWESFWNP